MCIEVLYNLYLKYACLLNQFFWLLYTKDDNTTAVMITLVMALSVVLCIPFLICYFELRGIDDKLKKKSSRLQHLGRLLLPVGIFSIPFFVLLVPYLILLVFVICLLKSVFGVFGLNLDKLYDKLSNSIDFDEILDSIKHKYLVYKNKKIKKIEPTEDHTDYRSDRCIACNRKYINK